MPAQRDHHLHSATRIISGPQTGARATLFRSPCRWAWQQAFWRMNSLYTAAVNNYFHELNLFMEAKTKTIETFKLHAKDTRSADVQVALLTERINHLTEHLQTNKKDHSSRRGLLMMVSQRRRLLDYLQTTDLSRYQTVTKKLKLRR